MTPTDLRRIGEALYGERWQTPLAEDLQVADRTVRRWLAGTSPMPDTLRADLHRIVAGRVVALQLLAAELRKRRAA